MNLRKDVNTIVIDLSSLDNCNQLIGNFSETIDLLRSMVYEQRDSFIQQEQNYNKYVEWWNQNIVSSLNTDEMDSDELFKWSQLVRQEIRMWIRLDKLVGLDEINWMSERRGFNDAQKNTLIEAMKLVELYTDSNTM